MPRKPKAPPSDDADNTDKTPVPTFAEWLINWLETNYPDLTLFNVAEARKEALLALPNRYLPLIQAMLKLWFTPRFNAIIKAHGYAFVAQTRRVTGPQTGEDTAEESTEDLVGRMATEMLAGQLPLWPLDYLRQWTIQNIRRRNRDDSAIRRHIVVWMDANPQGIGNLDVFIAECEREARSA